MTDFYEKAFHNIKEIKPNVKDATINTYLQGIKKISKELFDSEKPNIQYFKGYEDVKEYVTSMKSLASQKNMVTSILVLVKAFKKEMGEPLIETYAEFHKELSKKQEESYLDNDKTEREEKNWTTREEIMNKIESLQAEIDNWDKKHSKRKLADKIQQHLVLSLYTLLPPLRNDYALVKIIEDPDFETDEEHIDKSCNYINLSTSKLLLCKYKTDKVYGIKKIEIPEKLMENIVNWEKVKKEFFDINHNYMIINTTNLKNMKQNSLTKYINKIFSPKKISTTLLRKIYLSEKYPVVNTYRDQLNDAYIMCHGVSMQKMVYSKK